MESLDKKYQDSLAELAEAIQNSEELNAYLEEEEIEQTY